MGRQSIELPRGGGAIDRVDAIVDGRLPVDVPDMRRDGVATSAASLWDLISDGTQLGGSVYLKLYCAVTNRDRSWSGNAEYVGRPVTTP